MRLLSALVHNKIEDYNCCSGQRDLSAQCFQKADQIVWNLLLQKCPPTLILWPYIWMVLSEIYSDLNFMMMKYTSSATVVQNINITGKK